MNPLICTYFTHAGNVSPFDPNSASPTAFHRRAEACAAAGFNGMGFALDDINDLLERHGATELNRTFDALNMAHKELEVLVDWFVDGERRARSDLRRAQLLRAAEAIGARHIKVVGDVTGKVHPVERMIDEFGRLCDQARAVGSAITIELFPTSNLADLQTGYSLVSGANCSNGGLLLDIWHMFRGNVPFFAIAALPPGVINHVELDDGPALARTDYLTDTINERCAPGDGEMPVKAFMEAIAATGYQGLYGVEILSDAFRRMPVEEAASRAFSGAQEALSCVSA